jgi:hypothetical protein
VGTSFTANTSIADIDFASIHVYPDAWNLPPEAGVNWIVDHIRIARQLGKPLIIGEFGYENAPWSVYSSWMQAFENERGAGAAIWEIICATVCGNYGGSLAAVHPSSSPVPSGMAQYAAAAKADQGSPPAPPADASFTIGPNTASPSQAMTGQAVALKTQITASSPVSGVVVDLEVYDSSNVRVGQTIYSGQTFSAGTARSFTWTWPGSTAPGTYTFKVGVFNADWSAMYRWENAAATVTVSPTAVFTVTSTTASPKSVARGQTATITTSVKSKVAASGIQMDLELYNSSGAKVGQSLCTRNFAAGQTRSCPWSYAVPTGLPVGTYTVKVGVFSADWSTLHAWVNQAAQLVVK